MAAPPRGDYEASGALRWAVYAICAILAAIVVVVLVFASLIPST